MASWQQVARRIRVPLGFVLAVLYLWLARPTWSALAAGAVLAFAGVLLRALASGHITKDSQLTTSGPYACTRNPLYLGSVIIAAGLAVAARSWWIVLALVVVFAAIYLPVIRGEEAFLRSRFPEYEDYARRVPRFLPRFGEPATGSGSFSRARYLKHREYNALLGTLTILALLAARLLWGR
jgi:protein-S-isoprenylcysteine O-methyltransferase Ste14